MSSTSVRLAPSMEPEVGVTHDADNLYRHGHGHDGFALVRYHVSAVARTDNGPRVTLKCDAFELVTDEHEVTVKQLLADLIEGRGGDPTLPYPESDRKRYARMLDEWAAEEGHNPADVQGLWDRHFNVNDDPELHVTGPVGATAEHLREFLGYVGAIAEDDTTGTSTTGDTDPADDE